MKTSQHSLPVKKRLVRSTATALLAALAFTSCAQSGDSTGSDGSVAAGAEQLPIAMTVARGQNSLEAPLIAYEQGFFADEGLEVTMAVGQGAAATNSAVISGEFQVGFTDPVSAIRAIAEGMPIVVIAGSIFADETYDGPDWSGMLVPPGSPIKSWTDFEGAKIGVPDLGGLPQLVAETALKSNGVDLSSVEFVGLPLPALAEAAGKGEVDATSIFSIFYTTAKENGFTPIAGGIHKYLPNAPQNLWITSRAYLEENPEAIERFRNALGKGIEFSNQNVDVARQIYHDNTELPAGFIDNAMIIPAGSIELPRDGWESLLKAMASAGDIPDDLTYEDIVWEGAR